MQQQDSEGEKSKAGFWEEFDVRPQTATQIDPEGGDSMQELCQRQYTTTLWWGNTRHIYRVILFKGAAREMCVLFQFCRTFLK